MILDGSGNAVVAYISAGRVERVPIVGGPGTLIAGTTEVFDGPARLAILTSPVGVGVDGASNGYIGETVRGLVRRYDPVSGQITTVAGGGTTPPADGVAASLSNITLGGPNFVDAQGNLLGSAARSLWRVDARTGLLTRIAGTGQFGAEPGGDGGLARDATIRTAAGIVSDAAGNIFFSDLHRVRRIDAATGIITTIAGNGTNAYSGDGGPASAAAVGNPQGLALNRNGDLLICQGNGAVVRRVNLSTGIITTLQARTRPGGPLETPMFGGFGGPRSVAVDSAGNILVLFGGEKIQRIRAADALLETVASSTLGFFGDGGLATLARMNGRFGFMALDAADNIYIADGGNGRLRKLTLTVVRPVMALTPGTLAFAAVAGSGAPAGQALSISSVNLVPFNWTLEVATSAGGNWLAAASAMSGTAPSTVLLSGDATRLAPGAYRGTVTVRAPDASNSPQSVEVALTVQPAPGPVLGVSHQYLSFQGVQGGANPAAQTIAISNAGSGTLNWTATAETNVGGPWLRLSATSGTAPSTLTVSADITGIAQGTYQGQITVRNAAGGEPRVISVSAAERRRCFTATAGR